MEEKIVYFERAGNENTADSIRLIKERAQVRRINKVVVASTRGETARAAARVFEGTGLHLVVISCRMVFEENSTAEAK